MNPVTPDPIGLITALAAALPGASAYLPMTLAYLSLLGGICVAITVYLPAPTNQSPKWLISAYKVVVFFAGGFGHAKFAVAPGMTPEVRDAALAAAKIAHAAPEVQTIVTTMVPKDVIVPAIPVSIAGETIVKTAIPFCALILAGSLLSACADMPTTTNATAAAAVTVSAAQQKVQNAITLYRIASGIADVAAMAQPGIGVTVTAMEALTDPEVAKAQAALNDATMDAAALQALATAITTQANTLTTTAAPAVKVIPSAT